MQHLDQRLEHLNELEHALCRAAEPARVQLRVGIVLAVELKLADIDLTDQRRDVLVVVVAGLSLRDTDLRSPDGMSRTAVNLEMSPPNSSSRFTAQGLIRPRRLALRGSYLSSGLSNREGVEMA